MCGLASRLQDSGRNADKSQAQARRKQTSAALAVHQHPGPRAVGWCVAEREPKQPKQLDEAGETDVVAYPGMDWVTWYDPVAGQAHLMGSVQAPTRPK